jgi:hypothetical protein
MASGIQFVLTERLFQHFDSETVVVRRLVQNAREIKGTGMLGSTRQNLLADRRGLTALPLPVGENGFVHQRDDIGGCRTGSAFAARKRTTLTSVHLSYRPRRFASAGSIAGGALRKALA